MNDTESKLLGLILSEWVRLMLDSPAQQAGEGHYAWRYRVAAIQDLERFGVVVDPAWLGSSAAGRQSRRRAMVNLVADGWVTLRKIHRRLSFTLKRTALKAVMASNPVGSRRRHDGPHPRLRQAEHRARPAWRHRKLGS